MGSGPTSRKHYCYPIIITSWNKVRLSSLGTPVSGWLTVPAPRGSWLRRAFGVMRTSSGNQVLAENLLRCHFPILSLTRRDFLLCLGRPDWQVVTAIRQAPHMDVVTEGNTSVSFLKTKSWQFYHYTWRGTKSTNATF
jgi:hypothetical protein